ncbi:hypothetical protein ACM66Z_07455 [Sulfurovum sp. ST-21]|uniref:Uncharacterized protein n=1 Tax=Sulfurovum indicum TaxID=2779528 RepID=A0A7M1S1E6_9BACT|nr:hypothetical protein [Sulfurovum indicum]QOR61283.1 hypothetical protein IMZ28_07445 [Sulfurovum indicum]
MNTRIGRIAGVFLFIAALAVFISLSDKKEELAATKKTVVQNEITETDSKQKIQTPKPKEKSLKPAMPVLKNDEYAILSDMDKKDDSKEDFLERAEAHKEALARERGSEALERYYEQKEKKEKRLSERQAKREANKVYHEKMKSWREEIKEAKENGDNDRLDELKNHRPIHHQKEVQLTNNDTES